MGLFDGTALERPVICEYCGLDVKQCKCRPREAVKELEDIPPGKQRLKVRVEKRKRGKLMTVVSGFVGTEAQRQQVLKALKNRCGAGGTLADGNVEIQGDHVAGVREYLAEIGFRLPK